MCWIFKYVINSPNILFSYYLTFSFLEITNSIVPYITGSRGGLAESHPECGNTQGGEDSRRRSETGLRQGKGQARTQGQGPPGQRQELEERGAGDPSAAR